MHRAFLDANVLFAAAYHEAASLQRLWTLPRVTLVTSAYAMEEAARNLAIKRKKAMLCELTSKACCQVIHNNIDPDENLFRNDYGLPRKDRPILWAAIDTNCTHLLTGDLRHFGPIMDTEIEGVRIVRPAKFLVIHQEMMESLEADHEGA